MTKKNQNGKVKIEELNYEDPDLFQDTEGGTDEHPATELFKTLTPSTGNPLYDGLIQLLAKADIPEKQVGMYAHIAFIAVKYDVPAMAHYLILKLNAGLGRDREGRIEFLHFMRVKEDERRRAQELEIEASARKGDKDNV